MSKAAPIEPFQFKPGSSGNPSGRPAIPKDILEARKISQIEFERIVNKYLFMSASDFEADLKRHDVTKFEQILGRLIEAASKTGCEKKSEWLLARTLGKMREKLEIDSKSLKVSMTTTQALPTVAQLALENPDLSSEQIEEFAKRIDRLKEEVRGAKKTETLALPEHEEEILNAEILGE